MIVPVGIAFALVILALIVTMLMRRHLREKYAVMWLLIGAAMLVLALFPDLLGALAGVLGVIVPSNLLFALAVALLIGVTLHLSWELSRAEEEIRRVAEEVAILRTDMARLQSAANTASDLRFRAHADPEDPEEPSAP
ncbi:DUF2304 domain-containing protein [Microbacterium sp. SL75]|uniref:DUF2304 domain-containing protein n=1 Tax=Microbacterium sp. SL75 TaxID=2995140 RepID=UPI00226F1E70|nr:DUF2304 domain-containing protein [Microbacterium sp. SL75]WAC67904.1 DUF2304 domain-containing protein [Microbacterium sp. SL75]